MLTLVRIYTKEAMDAVKQPEMPFSIRDGAAPFYAFSAEGWFPVPAVGSQWSFGMMSHPDYEKYKGFWKVVAIWVTTTCVGNDPNIKVTEATYRVVVERA